MPLLNLPAELRNKIYKYTLTCDNGLHVRTLAFPSQRLAWRHILVASHDKALGVPYASSEFNQLKYVHKQLYFETAYSELKYNDITATSRIMGDTPPGEQFLAWLRTVPPLFRHWMAGMSIVLAEDPDAIRAFSTTRIDLYPFMQPARIPDSSITMYNLAKFCNAHPTVLVKYCLPNLSFTRPTTIALSHPPTHWIPADRMLKSAFDTAVLAAFCYSEILLGRGLNQYMKYRGVNFNLDMIAATMKWRKKIWLEELQAPNLKYLPGDFENIELLRKHLERIYGVRSRAEELVLEWARYGL